MDTGALARWAGSQIWSCPSVLPVAMRPSRSAPSENTPEFPVGMDTVAGRTGSQTWSCPSVLPVAMPRFRSTAIENTAECPVGMDTGARSGRAGSQIWSCPSSRPAAMRPSPSTPIDHTAAGPVESSARARSRWARSQTWSFPLLLPVAMRPCGSTPSDLSSECPVEMDARARPGRAGSQTWSRPSLLPVAMRPPRSTPSENTSESPVEMDARAWSGRAGSQTWSCPSWLPVAMRPCGSTRSAHTALCPVANGHEGSVGVGRVPDLELPVVPAGGDPPVRERGERVHARAGGDRHGGLVGAGGVPDLELPVLAAGGDPPVLQDGERSHVGVPGGDRPSTGLLGAQPERFEPLWCATLSKGALGEGERHTGVGLKRCPRQRDEFRGPGCGRLAVLGASLVQRPQRKHDRHHRERQARTRDRQVGPSTTTGGLRLADRRPRVTLALIAPAPIEHRAGQHIVEDLVPRLGSARGRLDRPQDSHLTVREPLEEPLHAVGRVASQIGEIVGGVANLGARLGDQELEEGGGELLVVGLERVERLVNLGADDRLRPAQRIQRLEAQLARRGILAPEPPHDHLEEGRLDAVHGAGGVGRLAPSRLIQGDVARADLFQHRVNQAGADGDAALRGNAPVVLGDGLLDSGSARTRREVVKAEVVLEQTRNAALESVEPGERVLADRYQDVHPEVATVHDPHELVAEALVGSLRLIEEVLLELVEDEEEVAIQALRPLLEDVNQRAFGSRHRGTRRIQQLQNSCFDDLGDMGDRVVAPRSADRNGDLGRARLGVAT